MKKKVLAIVLTTVLLLSLGLVFAAPAAADPGELVTNGGFESPVVINAKHWDIFPSVAGGWTVTWYDGSPSYPGPPAQTRPTLANLELHRGVGTPTPWLPDEGDQYAELDSDWGGPDGTGSGEPASVTISQSLGTTPGSCYRLSFAFSPRPNVVDNHLQVEWDGSVIADLSASGSGKTQTDWTTYSYCVLATKRSTTIQFTDLSTPDSLGTFLDDVSVLPISIEITKEADRTHVYEGDTINYLYRVHNDGDVPVGPTVVVNDSLPITVTPVIPGGGSYNRGDLNQNYLLDPCETWYFRASYTVPDPCARTVIPNTAIATAETGCEPCTRVRAESNPVEVVVLHPCIELEKKTLELAYFNGTEITYYYGVHNCGDTPLDILVVRDTTLEEDATPVYGAGGVHNRGDLNNNDIFEPCETWWFSLDHTLECDTETYSDFCNTAMAAAFEPILESRVFAPEVVWRVRIFQWQPRTIGYWGNADNHYTNDQINDIVNAARDNSDNLEAIIVGWGNPPYADNLNDFLLSPVTGRMTVVKARRIMEKQFLAAWLNVKAYMDWVGSESLAEFVGSADAAMDPSAIVYLTADCMPDGADTLFGADTMSVLDLLRYIEGHKGGWTASELNTAYKVLDVMNNAENNSYCAFMDPDFDPTVCPAVGTAGDSWCGVTTAWYARVRHGGAGGWRASLDDQLLWTGGTVPWLNGTLMEFELAYDDTAGSATLTVYRASDSSVLGTLTDTSVPGFNGLICIQGKTSFEAAGQVIVDNVEVDGIPLSGDDGFTAQGVDFSRDIKHLTIAGVSGSFTLTGDLTFSWVTPKDEGPALDINLENNP